MSDLIERLLNKNWLWTVPGALREEAAARIRELEDERDALQMANTETGMQAILWKGRAEKAEAESESIRRLAAASR